MRGGREESPRGTGKACKGTGPGQTLPVTSRDPRFGSRGLEGVDAPPSHRDPYDCRAFWLGQWTEVPPTWNPHSEKPERAGG